jgi:hypothetical protein
MYHASFAMDVVCHHCMLHDKGCVMLCDIDSCDEPATQMGGHINIAWSVCFAKGMT